MDRKDLRRYRHLIDDIERLSWELSNLRGGLSPSVVDGMPKPIGPHDPILAIMIRIERLQNKKTARMNEYLSLATAIEDAIAGLESDEREVICVYYLNQLPKGVRRMTDDITARLIYRSVPWVKAKKAQALKKIESIEEA